MKYISIGALMILFVSISACGPGQLFGPTLTTTPTTTLTPTNTPTLTITATPTNTPTLTATPVPAGPCDNPLIPLGAGNQWTYRVTTTGRESSFRITSLGIQNSANIVALVEYTDQKNNLTIKRSVICQDGAIVNYPLFVLNMLFSDYLDKYISAYHESVDYAPNYQALIRSNWALDWQAGYLTENEFYLRDPSGGTDLYIPVNTHIELSFYVNNSWESVTSPAGNFPQALKITQDFDLPVTFTTPGSGSGTGDSLKIITTQWYEPYIGLVRAQITSAFLHGTVSLPIESLLELVDFKHGN
jgi:hypothetical protein